MGTSHKVKCHILTKLMTTWLLKAQWCKMRNMRQPILTEVKVQTAIVKLLRKLEEMHLTHWAKAERDQLIWTKMGKDWKHPTFSIKLWLKSSKVKIENYSLLSIRRRFQTLNHSAWSSLSYLTTTQWECSLPKRHALTSLKLHKSQWCHKASSVTFKTITQLKCLLLTTWSHHIKWKTWLHSRTKTWALRNLDNMRIKKDSSLDSWLLILMCLLQITSPKWTCKGSHRSLSKSKIHSRSSHQCTKWTVVCLSTT